MNSRAPQVQARLLIYLFTYGSTYKTGLSNILVRVAITANFSSNDQQDEKKRDAIANGNPLSELKTRLP